MSRQPDETNRQVTLYFSNTPIRSVGNILSLVGILLTLILYAI